MSHTNRTLGERFPEIDEVIAFKKFIFSLLLRQDNQTKQNIANFLKTFLSVLKFTLRRLLPQIQQGLLLWVVYLSLGKALSYFLNPLGIPKYF